MFVVSSLFILRSHRIAFVQKLSSGTGSTGGSGSVAEGTWGQFEQRQVGPPKIGFAVGVIWFEMSQPA